MALTRVKLGSKVFLKSFDESYIKVNKSIEEKVDAMRKFRNYNFKKIYLDEQVFESEDGELKAGYLNINGLMDGTHAEYLNADLNLRNLDILVLAETKLDNSCTTNQVKRVLTNWIIIGRRDSEDDSKHMGLMFLSKSTSIIKNIKRVSHASLKRDNRLQVQGLKIELATGHHFGFVYCRSTPNLSEIETIQKSFEKCDILMGDLNLSHRVAEDQRKLDKLLQGNRINALHEITRGISNNQLDYILIDLGLKDNYFVTSYNNFISDHKTIVSRIGLKSNTITQQIKLRINFDQESHLRKRRAEEHSSPTQNRQISRLTESTDSKTESEQESETEAPDEIIMNEPFLRRFENPDMSTCWLNACLQLVLTAIDYNEFLAKYSLTSELGQELVRLHTISGKMSLDPSNIKDILVAAEDTRVATRLSEISYEVINQSLLEERSAQIRNLRLDLRNGQQCVRDFFVCLNENLESWPDVFSTFSFNLKHISECLTCKYRHQFETNQLYVELDVPPNNSILKDYVEDYFNEKSKSVYRCDADCKVLVEKMRWVSVTNSDEAKFLIVILTRYMDTLDGVTLVKNKISSTETVVVR